MKKLLIAKTGVAYAGTRSAPTTAEGAVTPDLLAAGAFGIYGIHRHVDGLEKFSLITNVAATDNTAGAYKANADDFNGRSVHFFLGANSANAQALASVSQPRQSSEIQLKGIRRLNGTAYKAAVKAVYTITFPALPTTPTPFDEYGLKIIQTPKTKTEYSQYFTVTGIYANVAALAAKFRDTINARPNLPYIASVSGNNLVITALYFADTFKFAYDAFAYPATVANPTPMDLGSGNYFQVAEEERKTRGEQGWLDTTDRRVPGIDPLALDDKYHTYIIDFVNVGDLKDETDDTFTNSEVLVIYIPQGTTQAGVLEAIFTQFYNDNKLSIVPTFNGTAGTVDGTTTTTTV